MRQLRNGVFSLNGREWSLLVACILAIIVFSVASPYYATPGNAGTVLRNSIELLLVGLGMMLLLAMGGIDVSVGVVMGLAAIGVGRALGAGVDPVLTAFVGPLTGALLGLLTAAVIVLGRSPPLSARLVFSVSTARRSSSCLAANGFPACRPA